MIFLIPIPLIGGSVIAYAVGKRTFVECYQHGANWVSNSDSTPVRTAQEHHYVAEQELELHRHMCVTKERTDARRGGAAAINTNLIFALQSTTAGMLAAAGVFLGAYSGSVRQLRRLPVNRVAGSRSSRESVRGPQKIETLNDFMRVAGPSMVLHSQALAVATVFSGLACGVVDGLYAEEQAGRKQSGSV